MTGSSWRPVRVEKPGDARGEPRWDGRNRFLGGSAPKCQKIALKMGVLSANLKKWRFAVFLAAKPSVLLWNSGLGLKVTQAW